MQLRRRSALSFAIAMLAVMLASTSAGAVLAPRDGESNVEIVLEGADAAALRACGDALVTKLRAVDGVTRAFDGERALTRFLAPRLWLFLSADELRALHAEVSERWDWEVSHQLGEELDDSPPPMIDRAHRVRDLRAWFESSTSDYFEDVNAHALVVVVQGATHDDARDAALLGRVRAVVAEVHAAPSFSAITVGYAGRIPRDVDAYHQRRIAHMGAEVFGVGALVIAIALATRKVSRRGAAAYSVVLVLFAGTSQVPAKRDAFDHPQAVAAKIFDSGDRRTLVPSDQPAKLSEIAAIGEIIETARKHRFITGANWEKFARYVPPPSLAPFTAEDLAMLK